MKKLVVTSNARRFLGVSALAILAMTAGISLAIWGCSQNSSYPTSPGPNPPPKNNQPNTVLIAGFAFGPTSMTVAAGTTVTWQNNDGFAHTATSDTGLWDTGSIPAGGSKSITFSTAGAYPYHCTVHPMMKATIIVQ